MNKIEKLIKEMCPNGVGYKKIKDIAILYNGLSGKTKNDFNNQANSKYITYLNVFNNLSINVKELENVQINENEKQNKVKYGDVLFTGSSETAEECGMSSIINFSLNEDVYLNSFCFGLRVDDTHLFNIDFLKYLFRSDDVRGKIIKCCNGVTRFNLSKSQFQNICIPIPPIEIQNEIVKILDTFTQLEAELEAELEARDKQYQYYRNKLLDFDNNQKLLQKLFEKDNKEIDNKIIEQSLSEIVIYENGKGHEPFVNVNGDYKIINSKFISSEGLTFKKASRVLTLAKKEDITMVLSDLPNGKALGKCYFVEQNNIYAVNQRICKLSIINKNKINPKFLFYILNRNEKILKYDNGVDQTNLNKEQVLNLLIPIPSLEIQTKIVNILDKLQDYSKDIKTGLPLEIEQRQKQYEYYRNLLLDFKANAQGGGISQ
ncbi:restriction endonuclease subunit S [Metamycoplasma faucium]|uniref:Restriction endonuclease subunit S n=1 Tax=Metamycoplasma faucium TaxID=56142 RepID=A0ABZ2TQH6_9BACT